MGLRARKCAYPGCGREHGLCPHTSGASDNAREAQAAKRERQLYGRSQTSRKTARRLGQR